MGFSFNTSRFLHISECSFETAVIHVIEDLMLERQGKTFAGSGEIDYDYMELIKTSLRQKRNSIKVYL
jgi:hypothetical protein